MLAVLTLFFNILQIKNRVKSPTAYFYMHIKSISLPNDYIYVTNELDFFSAQYYFDEKRVKIYNVSYGAIHSYNGKSLISPQDVTSTLPSYPQKAFIIDAFSNKYKIQSSF